MLRKLFSTSDFPNLNFVLTTDKLLFREANVRRLGIYSGTFKKQTDRNLLFIYLLIFFFSCLLFAYSYPVTHRPANLKLLNVQFITDVVLFWVGGLRVYFLKMLPMYWYLAPELSKADKQSLFPIACCHSSQRQIANIVMLS